MSIAFDTTDSKDLKYFDILTDEEMIEIEEKATSSFDPSINSEFDNTEDYTRMLMSWAAERKLTTLLP